MAIEDKQNIYGGHLAPGQAVDVLNSQGLNFQTKFEPEMIQRLPHMSMEELSKLEEEITQEFSAVSHKFVAARISRLEYLMESIDTQIQRCQQQDAAWTQVYTSQLQTVEALNTNTEDFLLGNSGRASAGLDDVEFEAQVANLVESLQSPLDLDDIFGSRKDQLPFAEHFKEIVDLHLAQLVASVNQKSYQLKMLDSLAEKNKVMLWKSYRHDVLEYKDQLIEDVYRQLYNLHKEYHGVNSNEATIDLNKKYYRSVVPLKGMKHDEESGQHRFSTKNIDKYYDIDNVYYKNNRIEVTDAKLAAMRRMETFAAAQRAHVIPQLESLSVRLAGCQGLSRNEVDEDIELLRSKAKKGSKARESASANAQPLSLDSDDESLIGSPREEAYDDTPPGKRVFTNSDYQRILNMNRIPTHTIMATTTP